MEHQPGFPGRIGWSPDWIWIDPYGGCAHVVDDDGLVIHASNYYRDLWFNNVSAPRLLKKVKGDFVIEGCCAAGYADRPALGGLMLWKDDDNFLRLDWNVDGPGSVSLRGASDGQDRLLGRGLLPVDAHITLRLERIGSGVRALCSADRADWYSVAEGDFAVDDPVEVGPLAIGMIHRYVHPGAWPAGSAIRFEMVRVLSDFKGTACDVATS